MASAVQNIFSNRAERHASEIGKGFIRRIVAPLVASRKSAQRVLFAIASFLFHRNGKRRADSDLCSFVQLSVIDARGDKAPCVIRSHEKSALIDIVIRDDGCAERIAVVEAYGYDIAVFVARLLHIGKRDVGDGVSVFFYRRHFSAECPPLGHRCFFRIFCLRCLLSCGSFRYGRAAREQQCRRNNRKHTTNAFHKFLRTPQDVRTHLTAFICLHQLLYTSPCAIIARATLTKPAIFAPAT